MARTGPSLEKSLSHFWDMLNVGDSQKEMLSEQMAIRGRGDFACKEPRCLLGKG